MSKTRRVFVEGRVANFGDTTEIRTYRTGRSCLLVLACLLCASPAASAISLNELLPLARAYDSQYRANQAQYEAAVARLDLAKSAFFPTFSLTGNTNDNRQRISYPNLPIEPKGNSFNTNLYSFQLTQPLYRRLNFASFSQSEAQLRQAEAQLEQAEGDLVNRLAQAFFEAIQIRESHRAATMQTRMTLGQSKDFDNEFSSGTKSIGEKLDANAKWSVASAQEFENESELLNRIFVLKTIVGVDLDPERLEAVGIAVPVELNKVDFWSQSADEHSAAIRAYRLARDAAKFEFDKARSSRYPTLDLVATYGRNKQGPSPSFDNEAVVRSGVIGVQFTVPLYSGGASDAKEREAISLLRKAEEDLETARRQVMTTVQQAYNGVRSNSVQAQALEQAVSASTQLLWAARQAETTGTRTSTEVLGLQQQLAANQRDLVKAQTNVLLNVVRLRSAIGDFDGTLAGEMRVGQVTGTGALSPYDPTRRAPLNRAAQ